MICQCQFKLQKGLGDVLGLRCAPAALVLRGPRCEASLSSPRPLRALANPKPCRELIRALGPLIWPAVGSTDKTTPANRCLGREAVSRNNVCSVLSNGATRPMFPSPLGSGPFSFAAHVTDLCLPRSFKWL